MGSFDFLPNYGILFIDTSVVGGDISSEEPFSRVDKELERLSFLSSKLSELEGLRTIPEVLKEYRSSVVLAEKNIRQTGKLFKKRYGSLRCKLPKIYRCRKDIFRHLSKAASDFETERTPKLEEIVNVNKNLARIKGFFSAVNGHTNDYETDTKLLINSLAYAQVSGSFVNLWTWDNAMAKTFVGMSKHLGLSNTGIVYRDSPVVPYYQDYARV